MLEDDKDIKEMKIDMEKKIEKSIKKNVIQKPVYVETKKKEVERKIVVPKKIEKVKKVLLQNEYPIPTRNLKLGDRSQTVKWLQFILKGIGLFGGEINETYDAETQSAVILFQRKVGFLSDGEFHISMIEKLQKHNY